MEKKDVYEYLAKIYLNPNVAIGLNPPSVWKKSKNQRKNSINFVTLALIISFGLIIFISLWCYFYPGFCNRFRGKWLNSLTGQGMRAKSPQAYPVRYAEDDFASITQSWQKVRDILPKSYCKFRVYKPLPRQISLALSLEPIKINFNLDSAKKEIFSINLNKINVNKFNALSFYVKKSNFADVISLKIEFTSAFKEKSEVYLKDISNKWQYHELKFSDFKTISNWSAMNDVAFIIEQWNTRENKGLVYLDNVRMFK